MDHPIRHYLRRSTGLSLGVFVAFGVTSHAATVKRLTPPSALFTFGDPAEPIISRFLPGQRFDFQASIEPGPGETLGAATFHVDGVEVAGAVSYSTPTTGSFAPGSLIATLRAHSETQPGLHTFTVRVDVEGGPDIEAQGNFEIHRISQYGRRAKNVIFCIGDGLGIAHRTAARLMLRGAQMGKANGPLAMDTSPSPAWS